MYNYIISYKLVVLRNSCSHLGSLSLFRICKFWLRLLDTLRY